MVSREDKLKDIKRVAGELGVSRLSRRQYSENGGLYTEHQIFDRGDTWAALCKEVALESKRQNPVADEEYFRRLKEFYERNHRVPKYNEVTLAGLTFNKRWTTRKDFLADAVEKGVIPQEALKQHHRNDIPEETAGEAAETNQTEKRDAFPKRASIVPPPPKDSKWQKWQRIDEPGFPCAPHDELGVVALFAILCSQEKLPFQIIGATGGKGTDSVCWDERTRDHVNIEFKYNLSQSTWNHPIEEVDLVVCWKTKWPDFPREVIELSARYTTKT
ncbi:MAG: hypothetical protein AB1646_02750 [Thermodesulfobacteriota bacterium]